MRNASLPLTLCSFALLSACGSPGGSGDAGRCTAPTTDLSMVDPEQALTLYRACSPYQVPRDTTLLVPLTIEAGVHVQFAAGATLQIGDRTGGPSGSVQASGTVDAPVVFERAPGASGAWSTFALTGNTAGSQLHYVELHCGGAASTMMGGYDAALTLSGTATTLLDHVVVADSAAYGLDVGGPLATGSANVHVEGAALGPAIVTMPLLGAVPTIELGPNPGPAIHVRDTSPEATATWATQGVPLWLENGLHVSAGPHNESVVLTLAAPNTLLFAADGDLTVGGDGGNDPQAGVEGLVARGAVTFDAQQPAQGWGGITFQGKYTGCVLSGVTIANGGTPGGEDDSTNPATLVDGAVRIYRDPANAPNDWPTIEHATVRDTHVSSDANHGGVCVLNHVPPSDTPPAWDGAALGNQLTNCGYRTIFTQVQ